MKAAAIIVCAGEGKRLGRPDKSILSLGGEPVFNRSLRVFQQIKQIAQIILVLKKSHFRLARKHTDADRIILAAGGRQRKDSVLNGLSALRQDIDYVLIHDAARPFISRKVVLRILEELKTYPGVICGVHPADTVKQTAGEFTGTTLRREKILLAQTPQGFRKAELLKAYRKFKTRKLTDDAQALELFGQKVKFIEGEPGNFKITYPRDLMLARQILKPKATCRAGLGFDVHRISLRKKDLFLGGVKIPAAFSLDAVSDGDVVLHALSDALCGAAGLGDIGDYFPPEQKKSKGLDSRCILDFVLKKVRRNFRISGVDVTVITDRPRLAPYKKKILNSLKGLLAVSRVNLKIKSKEGTAILGGKDAISSFALALLMRR